MSTRTEGKAPGPAASGSPMGGIVGVSAMQLAVMVVFLLRSKLLALVLGPDMLGVMAVIDKLVRVFAQAAMFSLPFAALRYLPAAWSTGEAEYDRQYTRMRNVIVAALVAATMIGVGGVAIEPGWFGEELEGRAALLLAAFATLPALGVVPFIQSALVGRMAPARAMGFVLLDAVVLALAAAVGSFRGGLRGIYLVYAVAGSALALFGLAWPRRGIQRGDGERSFALPCRSGASCS